MIPRGSNLQASRKEAASIAERHLVDAYPSPASVKVKNIPLKIDVPLVRLRAVSATNSSGSTSTGLIARPQTMDLSYAEINQESYWPQQESEE